MFVALCDAHDSVRDEKTDDFRIVPLGGGWCHANIGVAQDAWRGEAFSAEAVRWCHRYSMKDAARFNISLYDSDGALTCSRYWLSKMDYFYGVWVEAGMRDPYNYEDNDFLAFEEPFEFTRLCQRLEARLAQVRFAQLRALRPLNPYHAGAL